MPKEYEAIRDSLIRAGKTVDEAQRIAAATWNKRHPNNTNPWLKEEKKGGKSNYGGKNKKKKK